MADTKYKNREEYIIAKRYYKGVWLGGISTEIHNKIVSKIGKTIYLKTREYPIGYSDKFALIDTLHIHIENNMQLLLNCAIRQPYHD